MSRPYNKSFVCFECRRSFKRDCSDRRDLEELKCPLCRGIAYNLGRHFKPPKSEDIKQWEKVQFLFDHGFRFQKIPAGQDSLATVPYPETMEEAKIFVKRYKDFALKKFEPER